jgi:hypothetical protein
VSHWFKAILIHKVNALDYLLKDEVKKVEAIIWPAKQSISEWVQLHKQRMLSLFKIKTVESRPKLMSNLLETRVMIHHLKFKLWILKMFVRNLEIIRERAVCATVLIWIHLKKINSIYKGNQLQVVFWSRIQALNIAFYQKTLVKTAIVC